MKKNALFITIDSALGRLLHHTVKTAEPQSEYTRELLEGVENLLKGEVASLIVGMAENGEYAEYAANPLDDGIYAGELEVHPRSRKVLRGGTEISLTPKEFDILYFLAKNKGMVFTKEQIYQAVWAEDYLLADSNIMAFMRKLRKKIEPNPDEPEYILTIWGIGYKFTDSI